MPINPALLSWSLHALTNRHGTERPKSRYIAATGPLHTRAHLGMTRAELSRCSEECTGHAGDRAQIGTRVPERVKLRADRRHGPPAARRSSLCPSRGWPRLDEEPVKACRADLRVRPEPVTLDPRRRAPSGRAADDRGAEDRGAGELAPPLLGVVLSVAGHDEVLVSVDELAHDVEVPRVHRGLGEYAEDDLARVGHRIAAEDLRRRPPARRRVEVDRGEHLVAEGDALPVDLDGLCARHGLRRPPVVQVGDGLGVTAEIQNISSSKMRWLSNWVIDQPEGLPAAPGRAGRGWAVRPPGEGGRRSSVDRVQSARRAAHGRCRGARRAGRSPRRGAAPRRGHC